DLVAILDPSMELPANVADSQTPDPDAATPEHLLDALRFGHWAVASTFSGMVREWTPAQQAQLYLQLIEPEHARARHWLIDHGLPATAHLDDGRALAVALVDALPASADALAVVFAAGASPAGAGLLARAMQALADTPVSGTA